MSSLCAILGIASYRAAARNEATPEALTLPPLSRSHRGAGNRTRRRHHSSALRALLGTWIAANSPPAANVVQTTRFVQATRRVPARCCVSCPTRLTRRSSSAALGWRSLRVHSKVRVMPGETNKQEKTNKHRTLIQRLVHHSGFDWGGASLVRPLSFEAFRSTHCSAVAAREFRSRYECAEPPSPLRFASNRKSAQVARTRRALTHSLAHLALPPNLEFDFDSVACAHSNSPSSWCDTSAKPGTSTVL